MNNTFVLLMLTHSSIISLKFQSSPASMDVCRALLVYIFISLFFLQIVQANDQMANADSELRKAKRYFPKKMDCGGACAVTCSRSSRPNLCNRACGSCCARCNCVPAGTYGNFETCPCYGRLTTRGDRRKCH